MGRGCTAGPSSRTATTGGRGGEEGLSDNLMTGAAVRRSGGVEAATPADLDRELARLAA